MPSSPSDIIQRSRQWVDEFIVGHTICPFARREVERDTIAYVIDYFSDDDDFYSKFLAQLEALDANPQCETTLWLLPQLDNDFEAFLNHAGFAQQIIALAGYSGIYQIANFHPDYVFADSHADDPANYTNRSPHACLHLLREASLERVIRAHKQAAEIPQRNIDYLRALPADTFKQLTELVKKKE